MPSKEPEDSRIVSVRLPNTLVQRLDRLGDGPTPHRRRPTTRNAAMRDAWRGWLDQQELRAGLLDPQGLQDGIETLPRPLQQAAEPIDGDPVRRRTQAVVGSLELLMEDLRVQEPCQLLLLVEPDAQGIAHSRVARGWTTSMGRLPI